jgi:ribosomal protein L11
MKKETKEALPALIKKEIGVELAKITEEDKAKGKFSVGSISMEKIVKITKENRDSLYARDFKSAVKQVIGTVTSMNGVLVENKTTKEIIQEINEGKWDILIKG